jgi:hypothetical protein
VRRKLGRPAVSRSGGYDYRVTYSPKGSVKLEDGDQCYGTTDHVEQEIKVEEGLTPEREADTLIHEPLHQMACLAQKDFSNIKDPHEAEEAVCSFIGTALAGHIRDNPDYWRYIIKLLAPAKRKKPHAGPGSTP